MKATFSELPTGVLPRSRTRNRPRSWGQTSNTQEWVSKCSAPLHLDSSVAARPTCAVEDGDEEEGMILLVGGVEPSLEGILLWALNSHIGGVYNTDAVAEGGWSLRVGDPRVLLGEGPFSDGVGWQDRQGEESE